MSNDLISRSALFNALFAHNGKACQDNDIDNFPITINVKDVKKAIRSIPAAYDVDKVCRKINENKDVDNLIDADHAIKIVKSGECSEWLEAVADELKSSAKPKWIPAEEPPKNNKYILMSFENFSVPQVGRYEEDEKAGSVSRNAKTAVDIDQAIEYFKDEISQMDVFSDIVHFQEKERKSIETALWALQKVQETIQGQQDGSSRCATSHG